MPAQYLPPGELPNEGGDDPYLRTLQEIEGSDISSFSALADEAARTRTKGAGRDLIGRRNALLQSYGSPQRAKVGRTYYKQHDRPGGDAYGAFGGQTQDFINLISRGDDQFLQGLADDTGTGTGSGTGNTGTFNPNEYQTNLQNMIQQLLTNQQNQFNSTLSSFQGSSPTLSVGSVGNSQGNAASRARARNSNGIINTLSRRGRQSRARPRRYF